MASKGFYIRERQREQAERMAAKWAARSEEYWTRDIHGNTQDGWGTDTAGYCKTAAEAEAADEESLKILGAIDRLTSGFGDWSDVEIINRAVSCRDELDAGVAITRDCSML